MILRQPIESLTPCLRNEALENIDGDGDRDFSLSNNKSQGIIDKRGGCEDGEEDS